MSNSAFKGFGRGVEFSFQVIWNKCRIQVLRASEGVSSLTFKGCGMNVEFSSQGFWKGVSS